MKLEDQVTSLDLSKRLKELNIKQESLFYWTTGGVCYKSELPFLIESNYSAFTVAEMGQFLPKELSSNDKYHPYELNCKWELHYSGENMWHITYIKYNVNDDIINIKKDFIIYDFKESDARAKMLIYLIENKLIKVETNYRHLFKMS